MELIIFAGGIVAGIAMTKLFEYRKKTLGIIDVDHHNGLCNVRLTSSELEKRSVKKAVFDINHNANLSREEHIL